MDLTLALVVIAWFIGAFIGGVCGLGGVLMAMPLMLMVLTMHDTILISSLVSVPLAATMALFYSRYCDYKTIGLLLCGVVPGGFAGVKLLQLVPGHVLQALLGIVIIAFVIALRFCKPNFRLEAKPLYSFCTGVLGGLLGTSISVDGPIIGMYGMLVAWEPRLFLGISTLYYACRSVVTCFFQWQNGLYTDLIWHYSLYTIPASLLGFACSIPIVRHIAVARFRSLVQIILIIAGLSCLWRAF